MELGINPSFLIRSDLDMELFEMVFKDRAVIKKFEYPLILKEVEGDFFGTKYLEGDNLITIKELLEEYDKYN